MTSVPPPLDLEDVPGGPEPGERIIHRDKIPDGGALAIDFHEGRKSFEMVLVRQGNDVTGFHNKCPHASTRLDVFDSGFFDKGGDLLECGTHSARFRLNDGLCVHGPCRGKYLRLVSLKIDTDGWVLAG